MLPLQAWPQNEQSLRAPEWPQRASRDHDDTQDNIVTRFTPVLGRRIAQRVTLPTLHLLGAMTDPELDSWTLLPELPHIRR